MLLARFNKTQDHLRVPTKERLARVLQCVIVSRGWRVGDMYIWKLETWGEHLLGTKWDPGVPGVLVGEA